MRVMIQMFNLPHSVVVVVVVVNAVSLRRPRALSIPRRRDDSLLCAVSVSRGVPCVPMDGLFLFKHGPLERSVRAFVGVELNCVVNCVVNCVCVWPRQSRSRRRTGKIGFVFRARDDGEEGVIRAREIRARVAREREDAVVGVVAGTGGARARGGAADRHRVCPEKDV